MRLETRTRRVDEVPPPTPMKIPGFETTEARIAGVWYRIATNLGTGEKFEITRGNNKQIVMLPITPDHPAYGGIFTLGDMRRAGLTPLDMWARIQSGHGGSS